MTRSHYWSLGSESQRSNWAAAVRAVARQPVWRKALNEIRGLTPKILGHLEARNATSSGAALVVHPGAPTTAAASVPDRSVPAAPRTSAFTSSMKSSSSDRAFGFCSSSS